MQTSEIKNYFPIYFPGLFSGKWINIYSHLHNVYETTMKYKIQFNFNLIIRLHLHHHFYAVVVVVLAIHV